MLEKPEQILETIRSRELDIKIMELELKHGLTKNRAEAKLTIMYYKACNAISRAKLMMQGFYGQTVKNSDSPSPTDPVISNIAKVIDPWSDCDQETT